MTKIKNRQFDKSLIELEKEWPSEILPKEKLPLLGREKDFARIPIKLLKPGEIRFLINQGLGQKVLLPIAIEKLQKDSLADGDFYNGDLLGAVLSVNKEFWHENPHFYRQVKEILYQAEKIKTPEAVEILNILLPQKIYDFRKNAPFENE